jgi:hypothetical protein
VAGSLITDPFLPAGAQNAFGWQRFGRKSEVWNWSVTETIGGFCERSLVV